MTETKKQLVSWLTDAHAMERATIDNIERVVDQMDKYPQMAQRYRCISPNHASNWSGSSSA